MAKITLHGGGCHGFGDMIHPRVWKLLKENIDLKHLIREEILDEKNNK